MKTKQTIEVYVPEGYDILRIDYFEDDAFAKVRFVEKIQPRRIVLEETTEDYLGKQLLHINSCHGISIEIMTGKVWREVKETDLSLTNEDPKLSLSVDECKEIFHCKTANTMNKIKEFIKEE